MKVLYDFQIFDIQYFGGISRYFCELISYCYFNKTIEWQLPIRYSNNEYIRSLPAFQNTIFKKPDFYKEFLWGAEFRGKEKIFKVKNKFFPSLNPYEFNKVLSTNQLTRGNFDIFHPTYYDDYFLNNIGEKPFVLTVYDMIHELYPELFALNDKTSLRKRRLAKKANKVIAISNNTKKDLINFYGIEEDKIFVIYLASSLNSVLNLVKIDNLPDRYILYVGDRSIYKNFYFFVQSVSPLLMDDKDLFIVCTGNKFLYNELEFFNKLRVQNKIVQYYVNDASLAYLYRNALAFVFPPLYEGFGLPVLEAFSCGCPAVVSRISALCEIGGNATIYFDPKDPSSILESVNKVVYDYSLRKELIRKGYDRAKMFSWEKTAKETLKVYESVLEDANR